MLISPTMTEALFFDIDGTLVSFTTHKIPQSAVAALQTAHDVGIKIFIATGRPRFTINNLSQLSDKCLIDGYITMNGSYCFVDDDVVYENAISDRESAAIVHFCAEGNHPCILVGKKDMAVCNPDEVMRHVFYETLNTARFPEMDYRDYPILGPLLQITPFLTIEEENRLVSAIPNCESGRWHPTFTDITAKGNTKQHGIDVIIKHFGIPLSQTMAFGDGGNDKSMLCHAGIGVAMGQATEDVKQCADFVTSSVDEDGISNALHHFGII